MSYPLKGKRRCRIHGGRSTGRPPVHGRYSQKFRNLATRGSERLEELLDDPDLLDPKRPVALAHTLFEEIPLDEETIETYAEYLADGAPVEDHHRLRARLSLLKMAREFGDGFARAQVQAIRTQQINQLIVQAAVPVIREFGERVGAIAKRHLPDEDAYARFLHDLQHAAAAVVAQLDELDVKS